METIQKALFGVGGILEVRALLAYYWSGLTGYLFVTDGSAPGEILVITTAIVGYYFATRTAEDNNRTIG